MVMMKKFFGTVSEGVQMSELVYGSSNIVIYFVIAVIIVLTIRKLVPVYDELFRKLLHFVLLGSLVVWTVSFSTWWIEVITVVVFVILVYPILVFFERFKSYSDMVTERRKGELKTSLIIVFFMFGLVIIITEGVFKDQYLALASVYAWGVGDAFAALIGKKFGKHKFTGKFLSGKKSFEGTLAMFISSFISVFVILLLRGSINIGLLILISAVTAAASAACELYTKNGMDTITCPLASMTVLIALLFVFGGL